MDEGIDSNVILNEGMIDAMGRVGEAFRNGEFLDTYAKNPDIKIIALSVLLPRQLKN